MAQTDDDTQPLQPLISVITAFGRDEYQFLVDAAGSLGPLQEVTRGRRSGIEWLIVMSGPWSEAELRGVRSRIGAIARAARIHTARILTAAHHSPGDARNVALQRAEAPWFITLDSDDTICADGMMALLDALQSMPGAQWAAGRTRVTDERWRELEPTPRDYFAPGPVETTNTYWHARLNLGRPPFFCTATIASTKAARNLGGWPEGSWVRGEDMALWAVLTTQHRGVWVPTVVYQYRRHDASVSSGLAFFEIDDRLSTITQMVAEGTTRVAQGDGD